MIVRCYTCRKNTETGCFLQHCPVRTFNEDTAPSTRAQDDAQLLHEVEAFLRRKYVTRADKRQLAMGLSYVTAETKDLAKEIAKFIREWEKKQ